MKTIKIIAIEGLDKSGKYSAANMLLDRLTVDGYKVAKGEHHRYDQPTGELIMKWLKKEYDVDQSTIELIMTADKQAQQKWYKQLEDEGYDFLILDRYTLSQLAYANANKIPVEWTVELQRYMRKPDIDIVIDISPEVSMGRKGKHNEGQNDRYESDRAMLEEVRSNYILMKEKYSAPMKFIVNGEQPIDDVHYEIYQIVKDNLCEVSFEETDCN
ncbi:dTMP kinase [Mycobacterium sp. E3298]|nr:dTMP kinase [Mycobacterium sp. E3298]OBG93864.1 dTMP kinase [Mycobacterium sp. E3298]